MNVELKFFLLKLISFLFLSPLIGFAVLQIVENLQKAKKLKGVKKIMALGIAGFLVVVLLGWLQ